jgi:preprotein translocase subunit SecY
MHRDGEEGRKKITAITRYVTVGLALFESIAMAIGFGRSGMIDNMNFFKGVVVVVSLTAGSAMLMWIGERITEKGVGNGISIVLTINIISRIPSDLTLLYENFISGKTIAKGGLAALIIIAIILLIIVFVLILNGAERRIPVQYSKKMVGRKMMGGQSTNIPLKVNTAGVIPVIFASSILSFPQVIVQLAGKSSGTGIGYEILRGLSSSNWCNPNQLQYSWGLLVYIVLCVFFAYFYTSITFNPLEVADNIKKQGGFIPGIRPGKPTSDYLTKILNYIIFIGVVGLIIVAVIPFIFNGVFGASLSFGGTSLIIVVSVVLETLKQIESQMLVRNYKGFLNN